MKYQTSWTIYYYDFSKIKGIKEFQKIKILTARQMSVLLQYAFNKETVQKLINQFPDFLQKVYKSDLKLLIKLNLLDKNHNLTPLGEKVLYWYFLRNCYVCRRDIFGHVLLFGAIIFDDILCDIKLSIKPWLEKWNTLLPSTWPGQLMENAESFILSQKILEKRGDAYYLTQSAQKDSKRIQPGFANDIREEGLVDEEPKKNIKIWTSERERVLKTRRIKRKKYIASWLIPYYDFSKIKGIKEFQKIKILTARQMSVLLQYAFNKEAIQKLINQLPDFLQKVYKSDLKLLIKLNLLDKNHNLTPLGEKVLYWFFIGLYATKDVPESELPRVGQLCEPSLPPGRTFPRKWNIPGLLLYTSRTQSLVQNMEAFLLKHKILEKQDDKYNLTQSAQKAFKKVTYFFYERNEYGVDLIDEDPQKNIRIWTSERERILKGRVVLMGGLNSKPLRVYYDFSKIEGVKELTHMIRIPNKLTNLLIHYTFNKEDIKKLIKKLPKVPKEALKLDLEQLIKLKLLNKNHNLTPLGETVLYWIFVCEFARLEKGLSEEELNKQCIEYSYYSGLEIPYIQVAERNYVSKICSQFLQNLSKYNIKKFFFNVIPLFDVGVQNMKSFLLKHKILKKYKNVYYPTKSAKKNLEKIQLSFWASCGCLG